MSEQKLVSPLLDGFTMGNPMSDHDGVRCCPAIKENTEKKYIVKIISVPATQKQMDALLLAGAYKDPADAMDYFKDRAEDTVKEAELLQKLSRLEGFLPYEGWQIEPITKRRLGYEVYLLSTYKRSLEKHLRKNPVTHLEAFNMALDVCSALSVCRQAGALYVDLKPSNIFMSEQKEYRIGDLGFLSLDSLSYTTLSSKYRSAYTPPEFDDPMAPLNTTADTYALGMILYQLYNDSQLPSPEDIQNNTVPSPVNADYELAEIIMKAIHADPQQRWQAPGAMGQALVSYMQRNSVNDVPITPHMPLEAEPETPVSPEEAAAPDNDQQSLNQAAEADAPAQDIFDEHPETADTEQKDDTVPAEEDAELMQPHEMSEELFKMVAKADDLIAHETPEGVVVPEVPELPDPFAFATEDAEDVDDSDIPLDPVMEEVPQEAEKPVKKKKKSSRFLSPERKRRVRRFLTTLLFLAAMGAVGLCCFLYYQLFYLLPVNSLVINGTDSELAVTIDTDADETRLTVICSDTYGNVQSARVTNGVASFSDLLPDTTYTIELKIDGFHRLSGETTGIFTTDANTNIVSFTAAAGPEDGSFVLSFTVDGEEPDEWSVICTAEGEEDHRQTFTGHTVTVKNLTVGKVYTFTLMTEDDLALSGMTTLECMASRLILAEDLTVSAENETDMTVSWRSPGDVVVDSWNVRCYNNRGFETQFTVDETKALIPGIDLTAGYTIEVTASGMTQPARISITKDPIRIDQFTLDTPEDPTLKDIELSWEYSGDAPKGGWLLMYTVDGAATPNVISCEKTSAVVSPRIPGAKYRFTIQAANGTSVLNNVYSYECPDTELFNAHSLSAETITAQLLKTPDDKKWQYETISDSDFADTFAVGDKISVVLRAASPFYLPGSETQILYVFRDTHGNVIPDMIAQEKVFWKNIWSGGDAKTGELDIPITPSSAGAYVLEIYINGMTMAQIPVTFQ